MSQTCNSFINDNDALGPSLHMLVTNLDHLKYYECSSAVVNLLFEMPVHVSCLPDLKVFLTLSPVQCGPVAKAEAETAEEATAPN